MKKFKSVTDAQNEPMKMHRAAMGVVFFLVLGVLGSKGFAQSADPYDPNSPNYVGNKAAIKIPKWNVNVSASAFRSQDEFSETGLYYQGVAGYRFSKDLRGDVSVGYSHTTDFDAENPDRWQFEDITLRLLKPSFWKSEDRSVNVSLIGALDLPTSGTSLDASLYSRFRFSAQATKRWKKFTFAAVPTLGLSWHEFETSDRDGFIKNTPLSAGLSISARYAATSKLGFLGSVAYTGLYDYDFQSRDVQTVAGSVQYLVSQKLFTSLTYRWRDRVVTNNSLFDDDATMFILSMGYTL